MTVFRPRSWWTSEPKGGSTMPAAGNRGVALHYPGNPNNIGILSDGQLIAALRGWWEYHVHGHGWSDIAYQWAIDQRGVCVELRGFERMSAANGNGSANRTHGAVLLVLGNNEQPSQAMINAFKDLRNQYWLRRFPAATRITSHSAVKYEYTGSTTECPGDRVRALIASGAWEGTSKPPQGDPMTDQQIADNVSRGLMAWAGGAPNAQFSPAEIEAIRQVGNGGVLKPAAMQPIAVSKTDDLTKGPFYPELYAWDGRVVRHVLNPDHLNGLRAVQAIAIIRPEPATVGQFKSFLAALDAWGIEVSCGCTSPTCLLPDAPQKRIAEEPGDAVTMLRAWSGIIPDEIDEETQARENDPDTACGDDTTDDMGREV